MPQKRADKRFLGSIGEDFAIKLLKDRGYKILRRNYYTKFGEIDIIAEKEGVLIFVEVKLRKTLKYGVPESAVTKRKLTRIEKAGQYFCLENKIKNRKMRVDVVSILVKGDEVVKSKIIKVN